MVGAGAQLLDRAAPQAELDPELDQQGEVAERLGIHCDIGGSIETGIGNAANLHLVAALEGEVWPAIITVAFALVAHAGVNVLNILYINQFPDRRADEMTGKRHWVVRLGATRARWGYFVIAINGYV